MSKITRQLNGYEVIKLLKKLPVIIINIPDGYSVPIYQRFTSPTNDIELIIKDYDGYQICFVNNLFIINYSTCIDNKFVTQIFQIVLSDMEFTMLVGMLN